VFSHFAYVLPLQPTLLIPIRVIVVPALHSDACSREISAILLSIAKPPLDDVADAGGAHFGEGDFLRGGRHPVSVARGAARRSSILWICHLIAFVASTSRTLLEAVAISLPSSVVSLPSTKATLLPSWVTLASPVIGPGYAAARKFTVMLMVGGYSFPCVMANTAALMVASSIEDRMPPCTKPPALQNSCLPLKPTRIHPSSAGRPSRSCQPFC